MNIAILYPGLLNVDIIEHYNNHYEYILSKYNNIDVYCSTYDICNIEHINNFKKLFKPLVLDIEDWKSVLPLFEYQKNMIQRHADETNIINTLSMLYKIHRCYSLINSKNYDIIIRNRIDIKFDSLLNINENLYLNVPAGGDHRGGLMDLFAYGNQTIMNNYCNLYTKIKEYINDSKNTFHPELLLRHHCDNLDILINRFKYNIYLRGMNFTQTAPCFY